MLDLFLSPKTILVIRQMTIRQMLIQFINAAYSVMGTYIIWKGIGLLLNNDSPIVVVLSESMSPGFERGDILFLRPKNRYEDYTVGDITVFQINKTEIPIVHRTIKRFGNNILTKGDNNRLDDVGLYRPGQRYLTEADVLSRVVANLPYFGMITIWANSIPGLRFVAMVLIGLGVFFTREE
ncbi:signal peptidase I [Edhazardia aedis USNM 41457]|uniref:Signal peptidase complex catalytic subunit SEC11 n=1 Tax=Edhazardia aedis (strain USNM 41457) TaxID=1003232 RepID=J9D2S0_EDHAE|nr:signal peptidase I [Edhazardia aedis USNM 41457]|eukprot:EJW02096.1 signal peptidase I [Edhazardia aedis USNM 41457]